MKVNLALCQWRSPAGCLAFSPESDWSWLIELPDNKKYHQQEKKYSAGSLLGTVPGACADFVPARHVGRTFLIFVNKVEKNSW